MDIYNSPESLDLKIVASINDTTGYDFDMVVVWKHKDGKLYWQADSGYSCPSPFEEYDSLASLNHLTRENFYHFQDMISNRKYDGLEFSEVFKFLHKVKDELYATA